MALMSSPKQLDTHQKALAINLDETIFGSFAEIGAGQEVARWFLRVGAASGTVAKTVSAYDKEVSDDLYGAGSRYVSMERLEAMLDREWNLLLTQLERSRGPSTRFFSFVDTVSARNFSGTNECHGWMGIRFQNEPGGQGNDILLHLNLRDFSNLLQQEVLGIGGVNLIYAAFHQRTSPAGSSKALVDQAGSSGSKLISSMSADPSSRRGTAKTCCWGSFERTSRRLSFSLREIIRAHRPRFCGKDRSF